MSTENSRDPAEVVVDLLKAGGTNVPDLVKVLVFSPDPVAPGWRSETHQFELITDNRGCCDVLNGQAVSPLALRPVFASATAHIEELLDHSWGVGTKELSWCRWLPRAYNTVADLLCHIASTTKTSFREELWEDEGPGEGNLQARTDGGWHQVHGGVAAWVLWRFPPGQRPRLLAYGAKLLPRAANAYEAEIEGIALGYDVLKRAALNHGAFLGAAPWRESLCNIIQACAPAPNAI